MSTQEKHNPNWKSEIEKTDVRTGNKEQSKDIKSKAITFLENQKNNLSAEKFNRLSTRVKLLLLRQDIKTLNLETKFQNLKNIVITETKEKLTSVKSLNYAENIRTALNKEIEGAQGVISDMQERETGTGSLLKDFTSKKGYFNFISPENAMGLAGAINGETFTGSQLATLRQFNLESRQNVVNLAKLISYLKKGVTVEEAKNDRNIRDFLETPEGKFFSDSASGMDSKKALNNYYLNKARKLKNSGAFKAEYSAQAYYDKLANTEHAATASKEGLTAGQKRMKGLTGFANTFLSLDQLAILAASGGLGKVAGGVLSRSATLSKGVISAQKLVEGSKVLRTAVKVIPGVTMKSTPAGAGVLQVGKNLAINLVGEFGKFLAIEKTVKHFYGPEAAQMTVLAMMILPGAKAGFDQKFSQNITKDAKAGGEFAKYVFHKYGEKGAQEMIEKSLLEKAKLEAMKTGKLDSGSKEFIRNLSSKIIENLKKMILPSEANAADLAENLLKGQSTKIGKIPESVREYYFSGISDKVPSNLKGKNPVAWIDEAGKITYSKSNLESQFGIKVTSKDGINLFDGVMLKNHPKAKEIISYLKISKAHESTHRILGYIGIEKGIGVKQSNGTTKIYTQEQMAEIVDGSGTVTQNELVALEKALKKKLGNEFALLKNGKVDPDAIRRFDTKQVSRSKGGEFTREKAAAKSGDSADLAENRQQIESEIKTKKAELDSIRRTGDNFTVEKRLKEDIAVLRRELDSSRTTEEISDEISQLQIQLNNNDGGSLNTIKNLKNLIAKQKRILERIRPISNIQAELNAVKTELNNVTLTGESGATIERLIGRQKYLERLLKFNRSVDEVQKEILLVQEQLKNTDGGSLSTLKRLERELHLLSRQERIITTSESRVGNGFKVTGSRSPSSIPSTPATPTSPRFTKARKLTPEESLARRKLPRQPNQPGDDFVGPRQPNQPGDDFVGPRQPEPTPNPQPIEIPEVPGKSRIQTIRDWANANPWKVAGLLVIAGGLTYLLTRDNKGEVVVTPVDPKTPTPTPAPIPAEPTQGGNGQSQSPSGTPEPSPVAPIPTTPSTTPPSPDTPTTLSTTPAPTTTPPVSPTGDTTQTGGPTEAELAEKRRTEILDKINGFNSDLKTIYKNRYKDLEKIGLGDSFFGADKGIELDENPIMLDYDGWIDGRIIINNEGKYIITLDDEYKTQVEGDELFATLEAGWITINSIKNGTSKAGRKEKSSTHSTKRDPREQFRS